MSTSRARHRSIGNSLESMGLLSTDNLTRILCTYGPGLRLEEMNLSSVCFPFHISSCCTHSPQAVDR